MIFYSTYFYHVRHLEPHQIPVSTAVWDPKWFHNFQGQDEIFVDKNGVVNGVRAEFFAPDFTCRDLCRGKTNCSSSPAECLFLQRYAAQLSGLDFQRILKIFTDTANSVQPLLQLKVEPRFVLLFHEKPDNPCSERIPMRRWFTDHGADLVELFV